MTTAALPRAPRTRQPVTGPPARSHPTAPLPPSRLPAPGLLRDKPSPPARSKAPHAPLPHSAQGGALTPFTGSCWVRPQPGPRHLLSRRLPQPLLTGTCRALTHQVQVQGPLISRRRVTVLTGCHTQLPGVALSSPPASGPAGTLLRCGPGCHRPSPSPSNLIPKRVTSEGSCHATGGSIGNARLVFFSLPVFLPTCSSFGCQITAPP